MCSTSVVPLKWRVDESSWAVIFPLAYVEPLASLFFSTLLILFFQIGCPRLAIFLCLYVSIC